MAHLSALDDYRSDLRRATVTLVVAAFHIALIMVMLRSAGHSAADVLDITLFALPIHPDWPRGPVQVQNPPSSRTAKTESRHVSAAREPATEQHLEPSRTESSPTESNAPDSAVTARAGAASEPAPPIDWHAEVGTSARAIEQRNSIESGRRSLAAPNQPALRAPPKAPACPYEKCEPGWGANLGIFKPSLHSKAGRIEKVPDDTPTAPGGTLNVTGVAVIQWINNWCYTVIVSPDPSRRGRLNCVVPLGKTPARGDLFDHMNEDQPPKSHDTVAPSISYGLSIGGLRSNPRVGR